MSVASQVLYPQEQMCSRRASLCCGGASGTVTEYDVFVQPLQPLESNPTSLDVVAN